MNLDILVSTELDLGLTKRAYRHAESGVVYKTLEIPMTVVNQLGYRRIAKLLESNQRRHATWARQAKVLRMLEAGWKPLAVASELGMSDGQIYRIRQAGRPGGPSLNPKESS